MAWRIILAAAILGCIALAGSAQTPLGIGPLPPLPSTSTCSTFSLDGSNVANISSGTSVSASITTKKPYGVIVAVVAPGVDNTGSGTTISASTLTFSKRASVTSSNASISYWTAPYTAPFSGTINATVPSGYSTLQVFGIGCAATSAYFDTNASLPATASSISSPPPPTFSTSNSNDFIIGIAAGTSSTTTAGSGYTLIIGQNYGATEYKVVTSAQSGITAPFSASFNSYVGDAIIRGF